MNDKQQPIIEQTPDPKAVEKTTDLPNKSTEFKNVDDILANHSGDPKFDPSFYELSEFFGLTEAERSNRDYLKKMSVVFDYAIREAKSDDTGKILNVIKAVQSKIGPQPWDTKRLDHLYSYIRLAGKKQSIEEALKAYEK